MPSSRENFEAKRISFIHPRGYDYYKILRTKLHWGRGGPAR